MEKDKLKRNCPICKSVMTYSSPYKAKRAENNLTRCENCRSKRHFLDESLFLNYYNLGLSDRKISIILNIPRTEIAKKRKELNLSSVMPSRTAVIRLENGNLKCSICNLEKTANEFQLGRKNQLDSYRYSYCNQCRSKKIKEKVNENYLLFLEESWRRLRSRTKDLDFNLTKDDFKEIYQKQNGLCFYTDIKLDLRWGVGLKRNGFSVDRVDNNKGYVKENIVFCANFVNSAKRDLSLEEIKEYMPGWFLRISVFLNK